MLSFYQMRGQNDKKHIYRNTEFKVNEKAYLFGDNVKLRKSFSINSEELALLNITSEIKILEKISETYLYNGIDWHWYKVQYKDRIGYIIGGLISLDTKKIDNSIFLVSLKKVKDSYKILTRVVNNGKAYIENEAFFGTEHSFTLAAFNNRGIKEIKNMLLIDYQAEACGVDGGGYYLFNEGNTLTKAINLFEMSEAGIFNVSEAVLFPNDVGGKLDKILYTKTIVKNLDELTNRKKTIIESCEFTWKGNLLKLKVIDE